MYKYRWCQASRNDGIRTKRNSQRKIINTFAYQFRKRKSNIIAFHANPQSRNCHYESILFWQTLFTLKMTLTFQF